MKNLFLIFLTLFTTILLNAQNNRVIVRLENPLDIERTEVVSISWKDITQQNLKIDETRLVVKDLQTNNEVAYQLERNGGTQIQNLLIQAYLPSKATVEYEIKEGSPISFPSKTYCRYVPERKDDFAWENDRIAYRMYGKALEGTNGNAYGTDVWSKRVESFIIDKWYKLNNYHSDNGEGLDYYKVGFTLGAGDAAPFQDDKIWFSANYHRWYVLENGPLRSTFRLEYDAWDVKGRQVTVNKTISINAGSQLNKIELEYNWNDDKPLTIAAGIVKRQEPATILMAEQKGILAYWEPEHANDGIIGVACLFQQPTNMSIVDNNMVGLIKLEKPAKITYYNGAVWNKAGKITSAEQWFSYLEKNKAYQSTPIHVKVYSEK